MNQESKFFIGVIALTVVVIAIAFFFLGRPQSSADNTILLGENSEATGSAIPVSILVEFSDYQCPYCAQAWPYVEDLLNQYPDKLRFVYRHFPLSQHQFAKTAAYAAEAAGKQGKFWQMSDLIFQNQSSLSAALFPKLAQDLNLDLEQFNKDMEDAQIKGKVEKDLSDGQKLKVNSTPTFYLNGQKLVLQSIDDLKTEVENSFRYTNR